MTIEDLVTVPRRLGHIRWIVGGTAAGKSSVAAELAGRFDLAVYSGDRAELDWIARSTPERHPHLAALLEHRPGDNWRHRGAAQAFTAMASLYGEPTEFLIEDLLARPDQRPVLVDYFGILPRDLMPLLEHPWQAAFLVPTPQFRRDALGRRYADPARARANWGDLDPARVLETRLGRDALWDAEVVTQAAGLGLPIVTVDGAVSVDDLASALAGQFRLT